MKSIQKGKASNSNFEIIRERIMDFTYKPGQRLIERDLADEFGISRTPIREIIHKLEKEGLVIIESNKGAYVAPISATDIADIYQIRMVIEALAGRLVAPNISDETLCELDKINKEIGDAAKQLNFRVVSEKEKEFHQAMYRNCTNKKLYELIFDYWDYARRLRVAIYSVPGRMEQVYKEHKEIIKALRKRDPKEVEQLVGHHMEMALLAFITANEQQLIII